LGVLPVREDQARPAPQPLGEQRDHAAAHHLDVADLVGRAVRDAAGARRVRLDLTQVSKPG
jgi:hypothetical protein